MCYAYSIITSIFAVFPSFGYAMTPKCCLPPWLSRPSTEMVNDHNGYSINLLYPLISRCLLMLWHLEYACLHDSDHQLRYWPCVMLTALWLPYQSVYALALCPPLWFNSFITRHDDLSCCHQPYMGLVARKPVFGVSGKAWLKPVSPATETS